MNRRQYRRPQCYELVVSEGAADRDVSRGRSKKGRPFTWGPERDAWEFYFNADSEPCDKKDAAFAIDVYMEGLFWFGRCEIDGVEAFDPDIVIDKHLAERRGEKVSWLIDDQS